MRGMAGTCPILALKQWWGPKRYISRYPNGAECWYGSQYIDPFSWYYQGLKAEGVFLYDPKAGRKCFMLGNQYFNYLLVGKKAVLIECGVSAGVMSFRQDWQKLSRPPEIKTLVAMHEHFDHVCGIPDLKAMFPGFQL